MKGVSLTTIFIAIFFSHAKAGDNPYVCEYVKPLQSVSAKDWSLEIVGPKRDGTVCVTKVLCKWNLNERLPPSAWSDDAPPSYEAVVACSKDSDGKCNKIFKNCAEDPSVIFIDKAVANTKLNVKPRSAQGAQ